MPNAVAQILLVEDEEPHAELIKRAFEGLASEFFIHHVRSIREARDFLSKNSPKLIIADWRLPDGESMELLSNHQDPLATPIILMTSYGDEKIAVEALKSGALDYVVKSPEAMLDMPHLAHKAIEQWNARAERIRIQAALAESEEYFRLLAENASDIITRLTPAGLLFYVSPACKTILGYESKELLGMDILDLIHLDDQFQFNIADIQELSDTPYIITFRAKHKHGHYVWLETSARSVIDYANNAIIEIQAASRDITERKRAEEALQLAHDQLRDAYERTIEGWVHALDLRDRETEGHTQRVTSITVKVARRLGFDGEELAHIKRGALLHDMGKIAIPDEILQKPGPLNEAEWERMRKHPVYAYDMLKHIDYLKPALDIPYHHHERWNGSGYPSGLQGEQIPLVARLFAIVDVWDALRSDRPYRKGLPREKVIEYISENSGKLFDPNLVRLFLNLVGENLIS